MRLNKNEMNGKQIDKIDKRNTILPYISKLLPKQPKPLQSYVMFPQGEYISQNHTVLGLGPVSFAQCQK